jgi:hypothetical protein
MKRPRKRYARAAGFTSFYEMVDSTRGAFDIRAKLEGSFPSLTEAELDLAEAGFHAAMHRALNAVRSSVVAPE